MRWLKLGALAIVWLLFFVSTALIQLPGSALRLPNRWKLASRFSHYLAILMTGILNIKVSLDGNGEALKSKGRFIVSNHLTYVDGIILGSLSPVIYVSKSEVRQWRWIGQWTALTGTIFVDRQRKNKIVHVVEEMTARLIAQANVLVFPEGTSSNGKRVLPFQSVFFAAPLAAGATVVPVTLTYDRINREPLTEVNRDRICWYGGMDFARHVWGLLGLRRIEATVKIHPTVEAGRFPSNSEGRKHLSETCHRIISGFPTNDYPPQEYRTPDSPRHRQVRAAGTP